MVARRVAMGVVEESEVVDVDQADLDHTAEGARGVDWPASVATRAP